MNLQELNQHFLDFKQGTRFKYGISEPFSWRGSYDEVAFAILHEPMTREQILSNIEQAYNKTFFGYKGGKFEYDDFTTVNFEEEGSRNYSDGGYTANMIAKIEGTTPYSSQETRLIKLAFNND